MELCYLPYELLEIIFSYLKREDLITLIGLDYYLRDVIISSALTMRKLKLLLSENWNDKMQFVKNFGNCVKMLELDHCKFEEPSVSLIKT